MNCIVQVKDGTLRGKVCTNYDGKTYYSFQGIPYAKAPIGPLRFKAPLPPDSWTGIKDATKEGNISLQIQNEKVVGSENCLFLNIYTPQIHKSNELKSVLFWIHGGTFLTGSGNSDMLGPDYLITEDIIIITVNYRLGYLGFFNFEDPNMNMQGNYAFYDVIQALKWVQNNIESFCGDPNNVTIAGTSSGGNMTHLLTLSPLGQGLFHRAIIQSGTGLNTWSFAKCNPKRIVQELGYEENDDEEIAKILLSVNAEDLIKTQNKLTDLYYIHKIRSIGPVIEKTSNKETFLNQHPIDIIKSRNFIKVPIIIGYNSNEGLISEVIYEKEKPNSETFDDFERKIPYVYNIPQNTEFSKLVAEKIKKFFYQNNSECQSNSDKYYKMQGNLLLYIGIYKMLSLTTERLECPIYLYKCSADTNLNIIKKLLGLKQSGTCHGDEIGYLFKNIYTPYPKQGSLEETLIRRMVKLWCNFVKTGNPNQQMCDELINVVWKPVKPDKFNYLHINSKMSVGLNLDMEKMEIWNEISAINPYESKY